MIPRGLVIAMIVSAAAVIVILLATPPMMRRYHLEELRGIPFEPREIPLEDHVGARVFSHGNRYTLVEIGCVRLAFLHSWTRSESLFELRTNPGPEGSRVPSAAGLEKAIAGVASITYGFEKGMGEGHVRQVAFRIRDGQLEVGDEKLPLAGDRYLVVVYDNGSLRKAEKLEASGG